MIRRQAPEQVAGRLRAAQAGALGEHGLDAGGVGLGGGHRRPSSWSPRAVGTRDSRPSPARYSIL